MNIEQMPNVEQSVVTNHSGQSNLNALDLMKEGFSNKHKETTDKSKTASGSQTSEMQTGEVNGKQSDDIGNKDSQSSDSGKSGEESNDKNGKAGESQEKQSPSRGDKDKSIQELIDNYNPEGRQNGDDGDDGDDGGDGGGESETEEESPELNPDGDGDCEPDLKIDSDGVRHGTHKSSESIKIERSGQPPKLLEFTNPYSGK